MKTYAKLSFVALAAIGLTLVACSKDQMLNPSAPEGSSTPSSLQKAGSTTISAQDKDGLVSLAKVVVADANNGRLIANGRTDPKTGEFVFNSTPNKTYVVAVHTSTGYVGSAYVSSGDVTTILATGLASKMLTVAADVPIATLTYLDNSSAPIVGANIAVVEWSSFDDMDRGKTDKQGQFTFSVPNNLSTADFLAMMWQNGGAIDLRAALTPSDPDPSGGGGDNGWPAF